jgi:hypothetical protein
VLLESVLRRPATWKMGSAYRVTEALAVSPEWLREGQKGGPGPYESSQGIAEALGFGSGCGIHSIHRHIRGNLEVV